MSDRAVVLTGDEINELLNGLLRRIDRLEDQIMFGQRGLVRKLEAAKTARNKLHAAPSPSSSTTDLEPVGARDEGTRL